MSGQEFELSATHKADFERDGVVCLRQVLAPSEVGSLRNAVTHQMEALYVSGTGYDFEALAGQIWNSGASVSTGAADRFDMARMKEMVLADPEARPLRDTDPASGEGMFFYDVAAWRSHSGVRDVAFDSALPRIVSELIDANYLNFWEDTTFVKGPHTRQRTAFHQDLAYFQIAGDHCVIVWIALDPVRLDSGAMQYVRGSHRWGEIFAPNVFVSQTPIPGSELPKCPDIEAEPDAYDIVSFDVEPGDVIIHHVLTVHGSGGNLTDNWRRAMSFRYCGDRVRYFDRPGAIRQVGISGELHDGDRLFSKDYPVVWPKPWPELRLAEVFPDSPD